MENFDHKGNPLVKVQCLISLIYLMNFIVIIL